MSQKRMVVMTMTVTILYEKCVSTFDQCANCEIRVSGARPSKVCGTLQTCRPFTDLVSVPLTTL